MSIWWHLTILRLALVGVFSASVVGKAPQPRQFAAAVAAYRILPSALAAPFAWALISAETAAAVLLFLGWQSRAAAALCGLMLLRFALALGINLLRGRRKMDCGCFGSRHSQPVSFKLIVRDLALLAAAGAIVVWGGGVLALDRLPLTEQTALAWEVILPLLLVSLGLLVGVSLWRRMKRLLLLSIEEGR